MPAPSPAPIELLQAMRQLYAAIDRFDAQAAAALGVDRSALRAINAMERGAIGPGARGAELGLSSGSVTALLDRLERAGHVTRRLSRQDGRRRDADLTKAARGQADRIYARLGQAITGAVAELDEDRLRIIVQGLGALAEAFRRAADPGDKPA
jgi:DNA-binding MarR family transcriptional regulator